MVTTIIDVKQYAIHPFVIYCLLSEKMCSMMMVELLQAKHVGEKKIIVK
jgi:hypothetical protein